MKSILAFSVTQNASDLHLSSGEKIKARKNGEIITLSNDVLNNIDLKTKLYSILSEEQKAELKAKNQLDFAFSEPNVGRFRGNIFWQQKGISAVFRIIRDEIPTLENLNAPPVLSTLLTKKQGLILITGATGSGKSTTLGAMINQINHDQCKHIITLEDPIEFIYQNQKSLIHQREIGTHCLSFADGINSLLRQDPDVIVLGELRDKVTIEAALLASETGHLVFATLHTNSAIQTINRIVDVFPDESRQFIRAQLAQSLLAVIAQQLIVESDLTRKAVFEVLVNTPAVSHLIHEGKTKQIYSMMQTGSNYGMTCFDNEPSI
ncbi:PilT/PilU family type 4a pilus ATPase [Orbaceae bacterium ac157xtp]